jgi:hypothetical protein
MKFIDAVELAKKNEHLVGKMYSGMVISEIIIYPTNQHSFKRFNEIYYSELNAQIAITPFISEDVRVGIVNNKNEIRLTCILLHTDIMNLPDDLGAILE